MEGVYFFLELTTLIDIMLLGHWIEMRSIDATSRAVQQLVQLLPSQAHVVVGSELFDKALAEIKVGDRVLVRAGERIPMDGIVLEGNSDINEAMLTGESKPVLKKNGDSVIAGSINGTGVLTVEVKKSEQDSYIKRITQLVGEVLQSKSQAQDIADKAALLLTIVAIVAGVTAFVTWLFLGSPFSFALERMVSVMVVTCPHALGLAIPLVIVSITSLAARNGFVIRNRRMFEGLGDIDTIVFDKTGTLTQGVFTVVGLHTLGETTEQNLINKAGTLEKSAQHSIARAVVKHAQNLGIELTVATEVKTIPGKGIQGVVGGRLVQVGNQKLIDTSELKEQAERWISQGKTVIFVVEESKLLGFIAVSDVIRDEAKEACSALKKIGKNLVMITGDNPMSAQYIAQELEIETVFAQVLPEQKVDHVKKLQQSGKKVAMVGDGINDAPALAAADCGIAIGSGSDISAETADLILVSSDLRNITNIFKLSRLIRKKIIQNLLWATGYNVIAIPLAAGVLYSYGIVLSPGMGAVIMSLSTVIVAFNSRLSHL